MISEGVDRTASKIRIIIRTVALKDGGMSLTLFCPQKYPFSV